MMQPLYDIYFTGQLIEGTDQQTAKKNLAQLFKTDIDKIAGLFNGKPQVLKRGIDKAGALKYKTALHNAGLQVAFKAHQSINKTTQITKLVKSEKPEKIALTTETNTSKTLPSSIESAPPGLSLAPAGSNVLNDDEKRVFEAREIDTSNIKLVSVFLDPQPIERDTPPSPDTSHISLASAGEDLLVDPVKPPEVPDLNLDEISIAPVGVDLEQLKDNTPPITPDISGISLSPTGSDLQSITDKQKEPQPPNTDHISITED